jgi:hypothetical protein
VSSNTVHVDVYWIQQYVIKFVSDWRKVDRWFSPGTPVPSTNKTDHHDIAEILLSLALNTMTLTANHYLYSSITLLFDFYIFLPVRIAIHVINTFDLTIYYVWPWRWNASISWNTSLLCYGRLQTYLNVFQSDIMKTKQDTEQQMCKLLNIVK